MRTTESNRNSMSNLKHRIKSAQEGIMKTSKENVCGHNYASDKKIYITVAQ